MSAWQISLCVSAFGAVCIAGIFFYRKWRYRTNAAYRRAVDENDLIWEYWMAKDAFEAGHITAEGFFYDERFFPGWKEVIEKRKADDAARAQPKERTL